MLAAFVFRKELDMDDTTDILIDHVLEVAMASISMTSTRLPKRPKASYIDDCVLCEKNRIRLGQVFKGTLRWKTIYVLNKILAKTCYAPRHSQYGTFKNISPM